MDRYQSMTWGLETTGLQNDIPIITCFGASSADHCQPFSQLYLLHSKQHKSCYAPKGGVPHSLRYTDLETGSVENKPRRGRPSKLTTGAKRMIARGEIQRRNTKGCSVFRNELIAIDEALVSLASLPNGKEIWILSDRSAIQHLSNWQSVRDNVGVSILTKLKRLSISHQIHLQWISSHIDIERNEIADNLAKAGARELPEPSAPLTFLEILSRTKHQNKTAWITPPLQEHHWYQCSRPGGSLAHGFTRQHQTLLVCFRSGHIKSMKFSEGRKSFEMCTNCSCEPATSAHILECLGLTKQDLADILLLVLDFLKVYMSWTWSSTADQWGRATTSTTQQSKPLSR
ncbi:RNase H domain-containing protein [Trichonephila clavipes]|uniref:RNase H domain-containing protein n=1 Tax=Trichonephila clavipes TaxID=2585209 RepID=A0A8X6SSM8_TRICX|nr:RNase H domain-containing protein [Trichonephila clavipes]